MSADRYISIKNETKTKKKAFKIVLISALSEFFGAILAHIFLKKSIFFRPVIVSFVKPVCFAMPFFMHNDDFSITQS